MWGSLKFVQDKYWGAERTESDSLFVISPPFGRVAVARVDVLERDREVDEEEVEIVNSPETELLLRKRVYLRDDVCERRRPTPRGKCTYMLTGVESVPELVRHGSYQALRAREGP